jgi:type VI secretion system secreted protein Hcp
MAVDIFLKLGDIKGESMDSKHKDEIEIESFSFGQAGDVNDAGQRPGKISMQDFHFVMRLSRATPKLMEKAAKGEKVVSGTTDHALLIVRTAGQTPTEFLKIKFYDALISSIQNTGAAADTFPADQFSLWFGKIEVEYRPQDAKGGLGPAEYFKWDRIKGETYP